MIIRAISGLFLCLMLADGSATAESERASIDALAADPFAAIEQFSRCSARFEQLGQIAETAKMPANAEEFMGLSRGARAVAEFFAAALAIQEVSGEDELSEGNRDALAASSELRLSQVENFYQLERTSQLAFVERGQFDEEGFKYCFDVQPLQILTIEQMRRLGLF
jgi:hypothetical protein